MNIVNLILADNPDFKFVEVEFHDYNKKTYHYKTMLDVALGDLVIVHTPSDEFKCAKVVAVKNVYEVTHEFGSYKWVVARLDTTQYEANKSMEDALSIEANKLTIAKKRAELVAAAKEQFGSDLKTLQQLVKEHRESTNDN